MEQLIGEKIWNLTIAYRGGQVSKSSDMLRSRVRKISTTVQEHGFCYQRYPGQKCEFEAPLLRVTEIQDAGGRPRNLVTHAEIEILKWKGVETADIFLGDNNVVVFAGSNLDPSLASNQGRKRRIPLIEVDSPRRSRAGLRLVSLRK